MVYRCDACQRVYELNRTDISCIYCGACCCRPYEPEQDQEE